MIPSDPFEIARAELVEGLARMVNRVIRSGKTEAQSALGSIEEIRVTVADVADIDDFLEGLDAAERSCAGIKVTRRRGKHLGRQPKLTPEQVAHARTAINSVEQNVTSMAKILRVYHTNLHKALKKAVRVV